MPGPAQPSHSRARAVGAVASVTSASACRPDMLCVLQTLLERATVTGALTAGEAWLIRMRWVPARLLSLVHAAPIPHTRPHSTKHQACARHRGRRGSAGPALRTHTCVWLCAVRRQPLGARSGGCCRRQIDLDPGPGPDTQGVTWSRYGKSQSFRLLVWQMTCFLNDWHFAYKEGALSRLQCSGLASLHSSQTALGPLVSRAGRSLAHLHRSTEVGLPSVLVTPWCFTRCVSSAAGFEPTVQPMAAAGRVTSPGHTLVLTPLACESHRAGHECPQITCITSRHVAGS